MSTLHDKAIRLLEGGVVEVDNHWVRAVSLFYDSYPCYACEMDSACSVDMSELCDEVECISGRPHILKFCNG